MLLPVREVGGELLATRLPRAAEDRGAAGALAVVERPDRLARIGVDLRFGQGAGQTELLVARAEAKVGASLRRARVELAHHVGLAVVVVVPVAVGVLVRGVEREAERLAPRGEAGAAFLGAVAAGAAEHVAAA